jgi:hypothetical protein
MLDSDVSDEFFKSRGYPRGISVGTLKEFICRFPDDYLVFTNLEGVYPGCTLSITEPARSKDDGKWIIWGTIDVGEETLEDERENL